MIDPMELDARELHDLAGFFGRRFPESSARSLAEAAGVSLPASAGWTTLVTEAARNKRLPQLVAAAKRARPEDPAMDALGEIVGRSRVLSQASVAALAVAAVLGLAVLAWPSGDQTLATPAPAEPVELASAVPEAPAPVELLTATVAPEPRPEAAPVLAPERSAPDPAARAAVSGPCGGEEGSVVGYFYAGGAAPGAPGELITLRQGARVRADYPGVHNRHNAAAAVRCVLPPGSTLRLDAAPIRVPGEAVWVPLVAGSVQSAG